MKFKMMVTVLFGFSLLMSNTVSAEIISFDDYEGGAPWVIYDNTSFTNSGYTFTTYDFAFVSEGDTCCGPEAPVNGGYYLALHGQATSSFLLESSSGSLFNLEGFDLGEMHMNINNHAMDVSVTATYADNSTYTEDFNIDGINDGSGALVDFQTFITSNNFMNVTALTFTGFGTSSTDYFSIDNINLSAAEAVPEPSTFAIFALGIMGLVARRFNR